MEIIFDKYLSPNVVFLCFFFFFSLTIWINVQMYLEHNISFIFDICILLTEMDDEDCERRRMECLDEMSNLEKQFTDLKDQ